MDYGNISLRVPSDPANEHINLAIQMANEITSGRFSPEQENEMLFLITKMIKEQRNARIIDAEKHMAYLKNTYETLLNQK